MTVYFPPNLFGWKMSVVTVAYAKCRLLESQWLSFEYIDSYSVLLCRKWCWEAVIECFAARPSRAKEVSIDWTIVAKTDSYYLSGPLRASREHLKGARCGLWRCGCWKFGKLKITSSSCD